MNNPFSKKQIETIINGFIKYQADKKDIKRVLVATMPERGVWIDSEFYKESDILKPFIEKYYLFKEQKGKI